MRFGRKEARRAVFAMPILAATLICAAPVASLADDDDYAVVPKEVILAGQVISTGSLERVAVTNPNVRDDYLHEMSAVAGMVAARTLLPGRVITSSALRQPYAVNRGVPVRMTFAVGNLVLAASGTPLDNAAVGDVIRVRNTDTGVTVSGTVLADGTIRVMTK